MKFGTFSVLQTLRMVGCSTPYLGNRRSVIISYRRILKLAAFLAHGRMLESSLYEPSLLHSTLMVKCWKASFMNPVGCILRSWSNDGRLPVWTQFNAYSALPLETQWTFCTSIVSDAFTMPLAYDDTANGSATYCDYCFYRIFVDALHLSPSTLVWLFELINSKLIFFISP